MYSSKSFSPFLILLMTAGEPVLSLYYNSYASSYLFSGSAGSLMTTAQPIADFTYSPQGSCADVPVTFTCTTPGIATYIWNFGDGSPVDTIQKNTIIHRFVAEGSGTQSFTVKLTVIDSNGIKGDTAKTIIVRQTPDISLTYDPQNCDTTIFNSLITFRKCSNSPSYRFIFINNSKTDQTNLRYKFTWDISRPNDTTAKDNLWRKGDTVQHIYNLGNTAMSLEISGPNGCSVIQKYNVFLGSSPAGSLVNPPNTDYCAGKLVGFDFTGFEGNVPGTIYTFTVDDDPNFIQTFTSPPDSVFYTFKKSSCGHTTDDGYANAFKATMIVSNPCFSKPSIVTAIHVSEPSHSAFVVSPDTIGCTTTPFTFHNSSDKGGIVSSSGVCYEKQLQVWDINPKNGYTIAGGSKTGSINGTITDISNWKDGSSDLGIQFNQPGKWTIKIYTINPDYIEAGSICDNIVDSAETTICVQNPPVAGFTLLQPPGCDSSIITFLNTSHVDETSCSNSLRFHWLITRDSLQCSTGKQPHYINSSDTSASPVIDFPEPGYYHVQLSVTSSCTSSFDTTIFIKGKPKVSISPVGNICLGKSISPKANVKACFSGITTYRWSFPNGIHSFSDSLNPGLVTYNSTGVQTIILTAENGCGASSDTIHFTVTDKPSAFAGKDTSGCSGTQFRLGGYADSAGYTYRWLPANLFTLDPSTVAQPGIVLSYNGNMPDTVYQFTLTVSAGQGCDSTDTTFVRVFKQPEVTIRAAKQSVCAHEEDTLMVSGADSFSWEPNASIIRLSPDKDTAYVQPTATTVYTVTGINHQNGSECTSTASVEIGVQTGAVAAFAPHGSYQSCRAFNVSDIITASLYPQDSLYIWHLLNSRGSSLPTQTNTTGAPPDYLLANPGDSVFVFLETVDRFGCSNAVSDTTLFSIGNAAKASFTEDLSRADSCPPDSVVFIPETDGSATLYWDFGNGHTDTGSHPPVQIYSSDVDTVFTIRLIAESVCIRDTVFNTVAIHGKLIALLGVDSADICFTDSVPIINRSSAGAHTYTYDFGDGTSLTTASAATIYHKYPERDTTAHYKLMLTVVGACETAVSPPVTITVRPSNIRPLITIDSDPLISIRNDEIKGCASQTTIRIINASTGADYYLFDFGDGQSVVRNDNETVEHSYASPGTYTLHISMGNSGCGRADVIKTVTVFPVPVSGFKPPLLLCTEDTVHITALQPAGSNIHFEWMPDINSSPISGHDFTYIYTDTGLHTITLHTYYFDTTSGTTCGSETTEPVYVSQKPEAAFDYTPKVPKVNADYTFTYRSANATRFTWYFGDGDTLSAYNTNPVVHRYPQEKTYYPVLVAHNNTVCTSVYSDSLFALVRQAVGVPTIFTPNGDGINDYLKLEVHGAKEINFRIFNRWGQIVYHSTNMQDIGWDGTHQGALQPVDVYTYILEITYPDNRHNNETGEFTLYR